MSPAKRRVAISIAKFLDCARSITRILNATGLCAVLSMGPGLQNQKARRVVTGVYALATLGCGTILLANTWSGKSQSAITDWKSVGPARAGVQVLIAPNAPVV